MATTNLALVTTAKLNVVDCEVHSDITAPTGAAVVAGQAIVLVAATGVWALADADTQTLRAQIWCALRNAAIGEALTGSKHVVIDGLDLGTLDFGSPVYLSDTAGAWSSGTPTGGNSFIVGYIEPVFANGATADRLLRICTL